MSTDPDPLAEILDTDVTDYNEWYTPKVGGDIDVWGMFLNANIERFDQHIPAFGPLNERPSSASLPSDTFHWYIATDTNPISIYYYDGASWRTIWNGDASSVGGTTANNIFRSTGGAITGTTIITNGGFRNHLRLVRGGAATIDLTPISTAEGGLGITREGDSGHGAESRLAWVKRDGQWRLEVGDDASDPLRLHDAQADVATHALTLDESHEIPAGHASVVGGGLSGEGELFGEGTLIGVSDGDDPEHMTPRRVTAPTPDELLTGELAVDAGNNRLLYKDPSGTVSYYTPDGTL